MTKTRTKTLKGYRIQPMLPLHCGLFGAVCESAEFTIDESKIHVEAKVRLGVPQTLHTLVLSLHQALEADIIERTDSP